MCGARLTGAMVAAFLACGLASGAHALPLARTVQVVAPMVQPAAHKPKEWYWHGHWWRPGLYSDHVIFGMVNRRGRPVGLVPWGAEGLRHCAAKYRSFDPATGTYVTRSGERRICR